MGLAPNTLRSRLVLLIILFSLPGLAFVAIHTYKERQRALTQVFQKAIDTADAVAMDQLKLVENTRHYLQRLAGFPEAMNPDSTDCTRFLRRLIKLSDSYVNLGIPRSDGELLCNALPLTKRVNVADRAYIRRTFDSRVFAVGEFQLDRAAGVASMNFSYPVVTPDDGKLVGAVVAVISLDWWSKHLAKSHLPEQSISYISDSQGIVSAFYPNNAQRLGINTDDLGIEIESTRQFSGRGVSVGKDPEGVDRVFAEKQLLTTSSENSISVTVGIPFAQNLEVINTAFVKQLAALVFSILCLTLFAFYGANITLIKPIRRLSQSVRELEMGVHETVSSHQGVTELQDLTRHFSRMATSRVVAEQRLRAVFDQQFQFMAILGEDGLTLDVNELPLRMQGAKREDYVGKLFWKSPAWRDLPDWQATIRQRIVQAQHSKDVILTQDVYQVPDGSLREADCATSAIRDERGEVMFILVQASDSTDRRRAERERDRLVDDLHSLNAHLEQRVTERTSELLAANKELEAFAYTVSHDLRAPVRAISGFEAVLREDYQDCLPEEGQEFLGEIQLAARHMNALIEGLLQLSRSTRGLLESSRVDLGEIAQECHAQLMQEHEQATVELHLGDDLGVTGDPRLLRTLVQNLLGNAWKYRRTDVVTEIQMQRESCIRGMSCICVQDNGVGFNPEYGPKLFEPFQRLHRQDEFPGIGIGLATCARIVHRHGGDIAGCGRLDQGSRFCFTLPESMGSDSIDLKTSS